MRGEKEGFYQVVKKRERGDLEPPILIASDRLPSDSVAILPNVGDLELLFDSSSFVSNPDVTNLTDRESSIANVTTNVRDNFSLVVDTPSCEKDKFFPIALVNNGGDELPVHVPNDGDSKFCPSNLSLDDPGSEFIDDIDPQVVLDDHTNNSCRYNGIQTVSRLVDTYSLKVRTDCQLTSEGPKPFRRIGLDDTTVSSYPDRDSLPLAIDHVLPSIPSCPGLYLKSNVDTLLRPDASQSFVNSHPNLALVYKTVRAYGAPNYCGAKIPISDFPISVWKERLVGYEDQELLNFLAFGWPVWYEGDKIPTLGLNNHPSTINFGSHLDSYIQKELSFDSLSGPFNDPPFDWIRLNPCMTRPKKDSDCRRVILDLSFPLGNSVNSEIDKRVFDGGPYKLRLPTPLALAEHIAHRGENCLLFKIDLARAYRQLPSDPWDWPLLGLSWENLIYFDKAIPFCVRHGAMACQRTTEALCYAETSDNDNEAEAYIDDIAEVCGQDLDLALLHYNHFLSTIKELGLNVSISKCVSPTIELTWIGATFNSKRMIMFIDKIKVEETLAICNNILSLSKISKKALRSILGKLHHASKLCPPAKRFMNRLLQLLRTMGNRSVITISKGAQSDLQWFIDFLGRYNCRALIRPFQSFSKVLEVDACLIGGGGTCEDSGYFFYAFPECFQTAGLHIAELECFNILVGVRLLVEDFRGLSFRVNCDNMASVLALQSGKTRNKFLACVMRDLWFLCALNDINLVVFHKPGVDLVTPDLLSRGFKSESDWIKLCQFRKSTKLKWIPVTEDYLVFPGDNDLNSVIIEDL